ncbi:MAG: hypothetical protein AB7O21_03595 [Gammaproteobacteria bacterium]
MKLASIIGLVIAGAWSALALLQLWFETFASETFFKLTVTAGILLVLDVVGALVCHEYLRERELKDKRYLD